MEARIGLEVHVQLTEAGSKLFCSCRSDYRGMPPNSNTCPVCLGVPGALPVPSRRPIVLALAAARVFNCEPPRAMVFTRKHYFYPDLPKNYQITQFERAGGAPVCRGGFLEYLDPAAWEWRRARIRRVQLEEDPGRSVYPGGSILSSPTVLVDYNRSGVPLLEIVTEPDIPSPRAARAFVEYLLLSLEYVGAVNPRLEGAFRVDANISLPGGERVEVKNIGSTLDVERALEYEYRRQRLILSQGGRVARETRHWDHERGVTKPLRAKEAEEEYLYFPDPDIPPVLVTSQLLREAEALAGETPRAVLDRLLALGVPRETAWSIVSCKAAADVYREALREAVDARLLARIVGVDLKGEIREAGRDPCRRESWPPPSTLAGLVRLVSREGVPYEAVRGLTLPLLARDPAAPLERVAPRVAGEDEVERAVEEVIRSEKRAVEDYLSGRVKALDYLVGRVLRRIGRRGVDPRRVRRLLEERLRGRA